MRCYVSVKVLLRDQKIVVWRLTSGNGIAYQTRIQTDGVTNSDYTGAGTVTQPYWVKLVKKGSVYTAYGRRMI